MQRALQSLVCRVGGKSSAQCLDSRHMIFLLSLIIKGVRKAPKWLSYVSCNVAEYCWRSEDNAIMTHVRMLLDNLLA